jgi:ribonuclease R
LEGVGGDGILPMSALGDERFHFDEAARAIEGERSGDRYTIGQRLKLRLVEANPITGALRFEQPEGGYGRSTGGRRDRRTRRGR